MTHTPPIPAGNQSPYPLQTPPKVHSDAAPPPGDARIAKTPAPAQRPFGLIALAAGLGLAAVAGGFFIASRDRAPRPKGRKPRKKQGK